MDPQGGEFSLPRKRQIIRFVPNFSVFVLPPDTVCLYSEDRKFFLHGEIYCALASLIGAGKRRPDIVRALRRAFPAAKIDGAIARLFARHFVVSTGDADGLPAAYWASLGLMPDTAAANLAKVRVQIRSLAGVDHAALRAALQELGVHLVSGPADFVVVLVNDYLDPRLAELNAQQLTRRQDWMLVQPSGIFPLAGPIFGRGKSACWECLAHRMRRNRQVRAFLDSHRGRCVAASPLAAKPLGPSAIGLAALEIAKAIATDFRTGLHEHLVSLDLLGSTVVRHYVPVRPQCRACGREELREPDRAPVPIRLRAGGKFVATSGGYRAITPSATVARFRKHVSPLTGIVSHLERINSELPLNASYLAKHHFAPFPQTVAALKAGLSGDSYGKGSTAEQGEASALMEAIERYSGIFQGDEIRVRRRFADFALGDAIPPNDFLLFSDAQCGSSETKSQEARAGVPWPFDRAVEIDWSPLWSLRDDRFKYLPTGLLYYFDDGAGDGRTHADSNGCAAGNTLEEAIVQGFLELVERDAYAIWWYNRLKRAEVDLDRIGDPYITDLRSQLASMGRRLWALDVTSDLGVPAIVAVSHWTEGNRECLETGAGAHFDFRIAVLRAITELNQGVAIAGMDESRPGYAAPGHAAPLPLREHRYLLPDSTAPRPRPIRFTAALDRREQVLTCVKLAKQHGFDFLVLDQTRPDIEVPVARVVVPGLRHFYRRFAPGRLYDVPVKLGLRQRPSREGALNPLHPPI
jgi:oxazoline/thiazoline synthase